MYRINRRLRVQALFYVIQTITPNERHFVESNHYCSVVRQNGMTYISYGYFLWPSYFRPYTTFVCLLKERRKDTKREIRIHESKDMRYIYQKKYDKMAINDLQNTTQKTKDREFRIPLKDIQVPRKSRQILLHVWYLPCYTYYKPSDMS
jgi:hypothetical protein